MALYVSDATVITGNSDGPSPGHSILIEGNRISAIAPTHQLSPPAGIEILDGRGKYVIPGLLNANVHLLAAFNLESLLRYFDRLEDLILEASQIALKNGLTTVFDTWGPRRSLMNVRDRINAGGLQGSRIFCAGNIIGFDGPLSADFMAKASEVVSADCARRVNATWAENVGRHLMWLPADRVATEVRRYLATGIDFVKFASNDHYPGAFLTFSPEVQRAIVAEAHDSGVTAQAHCMSVEGLRISLEAGCDLIQHCNITGPVGIPDATLDLFQRKQCGAVVFAWTRRAQEWITENCQDVNWRIAEENIARLIGAGAMILFANDGAVYPREMATDPAWSKWSLGAPYDNLFSLAEGHFNWLIAMEEKGCSPMTLLRAATQNIAVAYGKQNDLGTLEVGKIADMLILADDPLRSARNYRKIEVVIKDGIPVDRDVLPAAPVLTRPDEQATEEERRFVPFGISASYPPCGLCHVR